ncbi:MAG: DUF2797 domain-containing protein [Desulfurococcales archaeon]|nr:DUF2797 domain-containing protein [Desulfurococcales archaeon]
MILRLVWKRVEPVEERRVSAGLLGSEYRVKEYSISWAKILLQDPAMVELQEAPENAVFRLAPEPWVEYCRWHSGPLDRPDNPLERIYCNLPAEGYCREHKRTDRALYELCLTLRGERGLGACRMLDSKIRAEYVVYMTDFGGRKPKVGVTRRFRVFERLAEQAHITATILATTDSAYKARKMEMTLSSRGLAQEAHRRSVQAARRPIGESVARLAYWAEQAARILGVSWSGPIVRVVPPSGFDGYRIVRRLDGIGSFKVKFYWGGLLGVEAGGGRKLLLSTRQLQHKDSIVLVEG